MIDTETALLFALGVSLGVLFVPFLFMGWYKLLYWQHRLFRKFKKEGK